MILLDTHIWVWWVQKDSRLTASQERHLITNQSAGLGVSVISCWEVAQLVDRTRLQLPVPLATWMSQALAYPGIQLLDLTPAIAIETTQLPGNFHRDPADRILVATARRHSVPLLTADARILAYAPVQTLS
jgi:PIN domain nuclease of toxin-antitoxin system